MVLYLSSTIIDSNEISTHSRPYKKILQLKLYLLKTIHEILNILKILLTHILLFKVIAEFTKSGFIEDMLKS